MWPILDRIFNIDLIFETSEKAIKQRQVFLKSRAIGICDIVASAKRDKIDASDLGMQQVELRPIFKILTQYPNIHTLLFTGGNSKNGPEYFFRRKAKEHQVKLNVISDVVPRIHQFEWAGRVLKTVSLTAPSGAANRAVGALADYKKMKSENPNFNTLDYRVMQYAAHF